MKVVIPCSGLGTRMGMRHDESKELLPLWDGKPIIEFSLNICKQYNLDPHVILRKEKRDLMEYCRNNNIGFQIIEPEGEWPNTILKSEPFWDEQNLLMLPDALFDELAVDKILKIGHTKDIVLGVHEVEDLSKWGALYNGYLMEKPVFTHSGQAWGLIRFSKNVGRELFTAMLEKKPYKLENYETIPMDFYNDVTRGKQ